MRTILPDDHTISTKLDIMGNFGALVRFLLMVLGLLFSLIISFAPPNTQSRQIKLKSIDYGEKVIMSEPAFIHGFSSLSSFFILRVIPYINIEETGSYDFNINLTIQFYDKEDHLQSIYTKNQSITTLCDAEKDVCQPYVIYESSWVSFSSVAVSIFAQSKITASYSLDFTSQLPIIAFISFVFISIITLVTSIVLFFVVPRRLKPSSPDHWATFYLGLFIFFVDGPWIILKYYTPSVASQIFDLAPEMFHIAFLVTITFLVSSRSIELSHAIFSSWIVRIVIISFQIILIVVQFVVTKLMPLCTFSVYIQKSSLKIPIIAISIIFHMIILSLLLWGIFSLQIERVFVLVITAFSFIILELIYIARLYIRIWIPFNAIGASFAADVFYILMANIITIFFLVVNMPFQKTLENQNKEIEDPIIDNAAPIDM